MSTTLSRNLKLRIDSNLTANARYNLEKIDQLAGTFIVDSTDQLNVRSIADILIEPESADLGGSGTGGTVNIGTASHEQSAVNVYASAFSISDALGLLDQGTSGTKYLRIKYDSTLSGSVDTSADRTLKFDLQGADRNVILAGNLTTIGGSLSLTMSADSSLTLPTTGTVATLAGSETLTNKTIDSDNNTLSNIVNANIKSSAAIAYSKLNLTGGILNADVNASAAIAYSKLNLSSSVVNADIASGAAIAYSKLNLSSSVVNADISGSAAIAYSKLNLASSILNADISDSAAISYSKLNLASSILNADISGSAAIAYSKLNLSGSVVNADISNSAAIAYSKLNLSTSIVNADVSASAAIAGTKISPDFGFANVVTSGALRLSDGSYYSALSASGQSANISYTLPAAAPTANQLLRANSSSPTTLEWATISGSGTVTSVDMTVPSILSVAGSPITTSGTLALSLATQAANRIFAGPSTGADAAPTFRALVLADLPANIDHGGLAGLVDDDHTQYHNDSRALTWLGSRSTTDLPEGTNQYFTAERVDDRVALLIQNGTGLTWTYNDGLGTLTGDIDLGDFDTADLAEGSNLYFTDERAQDSVGSILAASSTISFSYDDDEPSIEAAVIPGGVDHDSLLNFAANEHIDHTSVSIATASTSGLSGGGTIASTRNLVVAPDQANAVAPAAGDYVLLADASNSNALIKATVQELLDIGGGKVTATWVTGDGTSKVVTHNFAITTVSVTVFDIDSGEDIAVESIVRTDSNTVTLTSSQAPAGSGWTVIVRK